MMRMVLLVLLAGTACATAETIPRPPTQPAGENFFNEPPWSVDTDATGAQTYHQHEVGLRFPTKLGPFPLSNVHVYDARTNDVGFSYHGHTDPGAPPCIATISVYVYPATEPLSQHISQVVDAMNAKTPGMTRREAVLEPEPDNNQIGQHAAFNSKIEEIDTMEHVSIYERAHRFVKYRITMAPRDNAECDAIVRGALKVLKDRL